MSETANPFIEDIEIAELRARYEAAVLDEWFIQRNSQMWITRYDSAGSMGKWWLFLTRAFIRGEWGELIEEERDIAKNGYRWVPALAAQLRRRGVCVEVKDGLPA